MFGLLRLHCVYLFAKVEMFEVVHFLTQSTYMKVNIKTRSFRLVDNENKYSVYQFLLYELLN